jgi:hypothetical protein
LALTVRPRMISYRLIIFFGAVTILAWLIVAFTG